MGKSQWLKAYQMAPQYIPNTLAEKPMSVRGSLGPVPRDMANVETEGGETVFLPDKEGLPAHYRIHGPRHHEGGVPMNIPPDSFVFSDTSSMRIKDKSLQLEFGMPVSKKGYTPAEIARKYDINKYRKILQDFNSDRLQVTTAEQIIGNYQVKLGKLALIQESMKGFPGGIPLVALPFLAKYNLQPEMVLPTQLNTAGQMPMEQMPEAKYGGMPMYQAGSQVGGDADGSVTMTPDQQQQLAFLPNERQRRRMEKRAERDARKNYMTQLYINEFQKLFQVDNLKSDDGDTSTGIFYRQDDNGNPYFVDGRGVRIKSFDNNYYGPNNTPTTNDTKIIEKNSVRYQAPVKKIIPSKVDQTRLKNTKAEATSAGDIYLEEGKYYEVGGYDENKPIKATISGQNILEGNFEDHKARAKELLTKLEKQGAAVYHANSYSAGGKQRDPGWEIKSTANKILSIPEKEFLTDFFSIGTAAGVLGPDKDPQYNVTLQGAGNNGFYGYTDPEFYEYRYWKAKNQTAKPEEWNNVDNAARVKNRKEYLFALGFDIDDSHIKDNINSPEKLYTANFVSGKTQAKMQANRALINKDTQEAVPTAGLADAIEGYFDQGLYRPSVSDDKKLGLEHADAFTYDRKPATEIGMDEIVNETEEEKTTKITKAKDPFYSSGKKYTPWWLQDQIAIAGAAQDLFSIKKHKPYKAQFLPYVPEPTFYDPAREIAAIQETAGMASDVMRGMGTSSQSMGARLAQIQGTAAENIANTMGKYNNLNVGVANEFAYKRADILNDAQLKNQGFTKQYIDEYNALNQNYDNGKRAARANMRNAYIQGITNRAQAQVLNTLYPNYQIDPSTGGMLDFYKGMEMEANEQASQNMAELKAYTDYWNENLKPLNVDYGEGWNAYKGYGPKGYKQPTQNQQYNQALNSIFPQPNMNMAPQYNFDESDEENNYYQKRGGMIPFTYNVGYFR